MEQMSKSLSGRDKVLLAVLALMAIGALYYFMVFTPTTQQLRDLETHQNQVQTEIDSLTVTLQHMAKMKNELPLLEQRNKPVAAYDNLKPVMAALNNIMSTSRQFDITFETKRDEEADSMIRRVVSINFMCDNYATAKQIIANLHDVHFRCQISSVNVTSSKEGNMGDGEGDISLDPVRGTVSIVFFES